MKELIDKIIQDLGEDKPIRGILLKAQIVASKLGNKEFEDWIRNEQNGYPDAQDLPSYRRLDTLVKANVLTLYGVYQTVSFPNGFFDEEIINDCMFHAQIRHSLSEIENNCPERGNEMLKMPLPVIAYTEVHKHITMGNVQNVWQEFPASSFIKIVEIFKSKLLDFFLELDKKIDAGLDFSKINAQEEVRQIMNTFNIGNISTAVANVGDGTVNTGDITGNDITLQISDPEKMAKLQELFSKLEEEAKKIDNQDLNDAVTNIREECKKSTWGKKALRLALNAVQGIATNIAANQLTPIVVNMLALI